MTAVALKTYTYSRPPGDPDSLVRFLEAELKKLQEVVANYAAAILQLQTKVSP